MLERYANPTASTVERQAAIVEQSSHGRNSCTRHARFSAEVYMGSLHPHWQRSARVIQINRQKAYRAQGCRCHYCGVLMPEHKRIKQFCQEHQIDLSDAERIQLTAEHLIPVSEGGTNSRSNIAAACWYCNHTRHHGAPIGLDHQAYAQWVKQQQLLGQWHPDQYKALLAVTGPPDGPTHMLPSTQCSVRTQTEGGFGKSLTFIT